MPSSASRARSRTTEVKPSAGLRRPWSDRKRHTVLQKVVKREFEKRDGQKKLTCRLKGYKAKSNYASRNDGQALKKTTCRHFIWVFCWEPQTVQGEQIVKVTYNRRAVSNV